jgi:hypothetical protein
VLEAAAAAAAAANMISALCMVQEWPCHVQKQRYWTCLTIAGQLRSRCQMSTCYCLGVTAALFWKLCKQEPWGSMLQLRANHQTHTPNN